MDHSLMRSRQPTHTPYDGTSKLFTIGLKPLALDAWIEVDEHLPTHLAEKRRLYGEIPDKVFVEEQGTRDAQHEVLNLLGEHLVVKFPHIYRRSGVGVEVIGATSGVSGADIGGGFSTAP